MPNELLPLGMVVVVVGVGFIPNSTKYSLLGLVFCVCGVALSILGTLF